jgi:hypothetical protein
MSQFLKPTLFALRDSICTMKWSSLVSVIQPRTTVQRLLDFFRNSKKLQQSCHGAVRSAHWQFPRPDGRQFIQDDDVHFKLLVLLTLFRSQCIREY